MTSYKLDDRLSISDKGRDFFSSYTKNDCGDHFVSYISHLRIRWPKGKADHPLLLHQGFDLPASNHIAIISKELRHIVILKKYKLFMSNHNGIMSGFCCRCFTLLCC